MSIEDRVENIEEDLKEIEATVTEVKIYVTNHIPHQLDEVRADIAALTRKIKPLETSEIKSQGVHEFLNLGLKGVFLIAAVIWTTLQIFDKLNWFGI